MRSSESPVPGGRAAWRRQSKQCCGGRRIRVHPRGRQGVRGAAGRREDCGAAAAAARGAGRTPPWAGLDWAGLNGAGAAGLGGLQLPGSCGLTGCSLCLGLRPKPKIPRVPENLLKKRKVYQAIKATQAKQALLDKRKVKIQPREALSGMI